MRESFLLGKTSSWEWEDLAKVSSDQSNSQRFVRGWRHYTPAADQEATTTHKQQQKPLIYAFSSQKTPQIQLYMFDPESDPEYQSETNKPSQQRLQEDVSDLVNLLITCNCAVLMIMFLLFSCLLHNTSIRNCFTHSWRFRLLPF